MPSAYSGPLLLESLPIELHNTQYAQRGAPVDGIADAVGLRAWLQAVAADLPVAVHAFGYGGYPVTSGGWPSYYVEEGVGHA
ncbi:MAG: hypothetical protein ACRDMZ_16305, partial [Solirubrobacteraceae bacterium]